DIAIARQNCPHPRLAVDALRQRTRNRQRDVFLPCTAMTDGAGVLTTVARIDGDDDIAVGIPGCVRRAGDLQRPGARGPGARLARNELTQRDHEPCRALVLSWEP